jgi:hypothetical protein
MLRRDREELRQPQAWLSKIGNLLATNFLVTDEPDHAPTGQPTGYPTNALFKRDSLRLPPES